MKALSRITIAAQVQTCACDLQCKAQAVPQPLAVTHQQEWAIASSGPSADRSAKASVANPRKWIELTNDAAEGLSLTSVAHPKSTINQYHP